MSPTPVDAQRWLSVFNTSETETIPGYAIMWIRKTTGYAAGGNLVLHVEKPFTSGRGGQDPSLVIVNGPTPIPPRSRGRGTQDWPARVLHELTDDNLVSGRVRCGPSDDSWAVSSEGYAFTYHTSVSSLEDPVLQSYPDNTVLISPTTAAPVSVSLVTTVWGGIVDAEDVVPIAENIPPGGSVHASFDNSIYPPGNSLTDVMRWNVEVDYDNNTIQVPRSGFYLVSYSATVSSTAAPRGANLGFFLQWGGNDFLELSGHSHRGLFTSRQNDIELDEYNVEVFWTAENVAASGLIYMLADYKIHLVSTCLYEMTVADLVFSLYYQGDFYGPVTEDI